MPTRLSEVIGMEWEEFREWFRTAWQPGEHISLLAVTGDGKTTMVAGILPLRRYVLALDAKGGDEILSSLGWPRMETWPGHRAMSREVRRNNDRGVPSRYVVGPRVRLWADKPRLKRALSEAIRGAFDMGGWTVYFDELQVTSDRRMLDLSGHVAELLVSARQPKNISVVSSFQAPSWVPTEAIRQPHWIMAGATRDVDTVRRIAEVMGRDFHEIKGAMAGLNPYCFLVVKRSVHEPIRVTKARKVA